MKKVLLTAMTLSLTVLCYSQDTLTYTGTVQKYLVSPCTDSVMIQVWGGSGSNSNNDGRATSSKASKGSYAKGVLHVIAGDTLYVYVGGAGDTTLGKGGWNGGGTGGYGSPGGSCDPGYGGGGGGASDVRYGDTAHSNRVIIAGGGGGAGRDYCNGGCQPCGCGGSGGGVGTNGFKGLAADNCGYGYPGGDSNAGYGGTQFAPGNGGSGDNDTTYFGLAGVNWMGGKGANGNEDVAGGGGGGGYYGGGGGGGAKNGSGVGGGGGGGGSSYIGGVQNGSITDSVRLGNGLVIITPINFMGATSSITNLTCNGSNNGTATITPYCGTAPYMYSWTPGGNTTATASNLSAGTYIVTIRDSNGLTGKDTVVITQPPVLAVTAFSNPATSTCIGMAWATVSGGTAPYTYKWNNSGTTDTISNLCSGNYCVKVTDSQGCTDSTCIVVTGIAPLNASHKVNIYPNPFSQSLTIQVAENMEVTMYDMLGNKMGTWNVKKGINEINTQSIPDGVYSLQVKSKTDVITRKFVKVN